MKRLLILAVLLVAVAVMAQRVTEDIVVHGMGVFTEVEQRIAADRQWVSSVDVVTTDIAEIYFFRQITGEPRTHTVGPFYMEAGVARNFPLSADRVNFFELWSDGSATITPLR